ncbi:MULTISPECIES: ParB/RepB/Spo0J family partition protein [Aliivibrio]|uniref:Probable chromosome-partitioning protein ParB n=1 Tax=Aliivibrio finisterrensis TaxID=511998 RepID=A0A4V1Z8Q3_9GAMM|nr:MULTISPECIES: ParB/RepB/Spo0J family partition protein [Aliivibrio]MDD9179595.1 ParB/RepB/Spo0J family partition protein [Aliivibrio sp. A6]RYU50697.1 ParB/RepB/Spo0J family partition protein [Aliivibrio finisterrensis]RYU51482.1 ParB/RepB/Spo0J family partition protein [Aliivibrio finisterrensis]RYU56329.1 ParB/RepB/Spo0J family partition protein [Aliivibrio finisterrensis]RYU63738.1 ParB/RepB/Spo0J family partition protein [Aliivibrio finisterrensis]
MGNKRGLGKGLDALLATSSIAREKQSAAEQSESISKDAQLIELGIHQLSAGQYQPRKTMEEEALEELSASIRSQGIIQPIVVRQVAPQQYEIIAGERRFRAAKKAGLKHVPCVVKSVEDKAVIAMALIENIQREDLNAIEEAQALERLQQEFELTHQQISDVIGKSRTTVTNLLRLNALTDEVKGFVEKKELEMGHARALLALESKQQIELAHLVIKKRLTVRQTEQQVKALLSPKAEKEPVKQDSEMIEISNKLTSALGSKVVINRNSSGSGKVTITFDEAHKLEQLIAKLES